jgi:hypothetical protein
MSVLSNRHARPPTFLTRQPARTVHVLFPAASDDAESLFGGVGDDPDDQAIGVESLAPPLPAPSPEMTEEAAARLGVAIATLRRTSDRLGAELAANALEIGCLIAARILEAELKGDPALRWALVQSAVRRLGDVNRVTIHLAPGDRQAVEGAAGEAALAELAIAKVDILTDTNLTPGDCLVESDAAMVDGRLGTRLEEIRRVLTAAINETENPSS